MTTAYSKTVETARTYYNSDDADNFYATIWGGEDIHIGLYEKDSDTIFEASLRTVAKMASLLNLNSSTKVLDIGAGYGGTARYLSKSMGCHVTCLNLSETQNQRNRKMNQEQGLADKIEVLDGDFENIPSSALSYDVVVSQDAILHSGNRRKVLEEVARVIKPGGDFLFTDPMQEDDCPPGELKPVLERIHLDSMGSIDFYRQTAKQLGFEEIQVIKMTQQLVNHYSRVLQELESREAEISKVCSQDYINRMKVGLNHWIKKGNQGYLAWGILHFQKEN